MPITTSTRSTDGFDSTIAVRSFSFELDATGESAPNTLESLVGTYAACYVPALRVAADKHEIEDLGTVQIDTTGELNDDDKLASVTFDISTEGSLDEETAVKIVEDANRLCKVHAALREDLHATVILDGHEAN